MTDAISQQMEEAVKDMVDDMLLTNYDLRYNLTLVLLPQENNNTVTLVQSDDGGEVLSMLFPFTGVKVRINPNDPEPTKARGFVSATLFKTLQALKEFKGSPVLRIGSKSELKDYYKGLGRAALAVAHGTMPEIPGVVDSTVEMTVKATDDEQISAFYVVDLHYVYTMNGASAFENIVKWSAKVKEKSDKFVMPFRFTIAVPVEHMDLMADSMPALLKDLGFTYSATGQPDTAVPFEKHHAMRLLGKAGDNVRSFGLFTLAF